MHAVVVGPDRELAAALRAEGVETVRIEGPANAEALAEAGIDGAALLVVTDVGEATAIPLAREGNPALRVVVYSPSSMPEFVRGQVDLAVSPGVLSPAVIAEELAGNGA